MTFTYEFIPEQADVRKHIQACEGHHTQQAIYSTFHDALTQVCFGCFKVRSTIYRPEPKSVQEVMRLWMRERRKLRKAQGLCVSCGGFPLVTLTTCAKCNARSKRRYIQVKKRKESSR